MTSAVPLMLALGRAAVAAGSTAMGAEAERATLWLTLTTAVPLAASTLTMVVPGATPGPMTALPGVKLEAATPAGSVSTVPLMLEPGRACSTGGSTVMAAEVVTLWLTLSTAVPLEAL